MVGTILSQLIARLVPDVDRDACQSCEHYRKMMDRVGVKQCKIEREEIIAALRASAARIPWLAKVSAIGPAITSGLAFKVNPFDPIPGLFDEAVRLAELQEGKR